MRRALAMMFLTLSAFAQSPPSSQLASACGSKDVSFGVNLDLTRHNLASPEPGKARVYFIQDDGSWGDHEHYVLKIGLDGTWIGAYKQNSYFTVSAAPGEHHVCARVQSRYSVGRLLALVRFTAESGKTYYFRTRFLGGMPGIGTTPQYVELDPVDSDEAQYLMASDPLSVSQAKK